MSKLIKATEKFAKRVLGGDSSGHDWQHIERVRRTALEIGRAEKADLLVVELAVLLHDVGDYKIVGGTEDDYTVAENWLKKQKVDQVIIDRVMFIITNMSFSKTFTKDKVAKNKELFVVQDADRLDAIGAIGIARTFAFGGKKGRLLYDPTKEVRAVKNLKHYRQGASSTIHHFYEKLLLVKDLINTKAGKKIAAERHKFMLIYLKQFYKEWLGK